MAPFALVAFGHYVKYATLAPTGIGRVRAAAAAAEKRGKDVARNLEEAAQKHASQPDNVAIAAPIPAASTKAPTIQASTTAKATPSRDNAQKKKVIGMMGAVCAAGSESTAKCAVPVTSAHDSGVTCRSCRRRRLPRRFFSQPG